VLCPRETTRVLSSLAAYTPLLLGSALKLGPGGPIPHIKVDVDCDEYGQGANAEVIIEQ
jgi:hypothetical protein